MRFFSLKYLVAAVLLAGIFLLPDPFSDDRFPFPDGTYLFDGRTRVNFETELGEVVDNISLKLWPGEHEAFQVLISMRENPGKVFLNASLDQVPKDSGEGPPSGQSEPHYIVSPPSLELFLEHYVEIEKSNISRGALGEYPDALIPYPLGEFLDVSTTGYLTLYIRISTAEQTSPGVYDGKLFLNQGKAAEEIAFEITILDADIDATPLPVAIGTSSSSLRRFMQTKDVTPGSGNPDVAREDIYVQFATTLLDAKACPIGLDFLTHPKFTDVETESTYSYERADLTYSYFPKTPKIQFPYTFNDLRETDITDADPLSEEWLMDVSNYIEVVAKHFRKNSMMDRAFCYVLDEPNSKDDYFRVIEFGEMLNKAAPDLDFLVTEQPYLLPGQDDWPSLDGVVDIWCPQMGFYRTNECTKQQQAGKEVWIYPNQRDFRSTEPEILSPTLNIGDEFLAPQILTALIYRHEIDGLLYWESLYWRHADPYVDPDPSGDTDREFFGNGDGYLFYPGDAVSRHYSDLQDIYHPLPSLRWMNLIEGLEDYRLLKSVGFDRMKIPDSRDLLANPEKYSILIDKAKADLTSG